VHGGAVEEGGEPRRGGDPGAQHARRAALDAERGDMVARDAGGAGARAGPREAERVENVDLAARDRGVGYVGGAGVAREPGQGLG